MALPNQPPFLPLQPLSLLNRNGDRVLQGEREALHIFGVDHDTVDGTCVRDYIHVTDLVGAHVKALKVLTGGGVKTYNVGVGKGRSVREFVTACAEVTGANITVVEKPRRDGDAAVVYADPAKIKTVSQSRVQPVRASVSLRHNGRAHVKARAGAYQLVRPRTVSPSHSAVQRLQFTWATCHCVGGAVRRRLAGRPSSAISSRPSGQRGSGRRSTPSTFPLNCSGSWSPPCDSLRGKGFLPCRTAQALWPTRGRLAWLAVRTTRWHHDLLLRVA